MKPFCTTLRTLESLKGKWRVLVNALTILVLLALPAQATQDGWPALFDVTGVASDDVLNVRQFPNGSSAIIGTLSHAAKDIEVIMPNADETWGLVNIQGTPGWVSLSFLARHPGQTDGLFPEYTTCFGTEPFWSLARQDGTLTLDVAFDDRPATAELIDWEGGTVNHRLRYSFGSANMIGVLSRHSCNDGMSDQEFGLELNLLLPKEQIHLQGCCTIRPRGE